MEIRTEERSGSSKMRATWAGLSGHPAALRVPPSRARRRGARHVRFAVWTTLLVTIVCVAGAVASPARTSRNASEATIARAATAHVAPLPVRPAGPAPFHR
jgi:hypothetical protein